MKNHTFDFKDLGFKAYDISHDNPYDFNQIHRHTYFEIFLFKNGDNGSQIIDFTKYEINSKNLYIVAPNQVHLMQRKIDEDGIVIQFTNEFLQTSISPIQLDWLYQIRTSPQTALSDVNFDKIYFSFEKLKKLYLLKGNYRQEQIRHYFAYTIFQILELLPTNIHIHDNKKIVYQFIEMAEQNFKEQTKVNTYANKLAISVSHLNRALKDRFGKTALEILHDLLLVEIKRLLLVEQLSNKEISYILNFDSQSSFSRFVRKHTGYSPSNFKIKFAQE